VVLVARSKSEISVLADDLEKKYNVKAYAIVSDLSNESGITSLMEKYQILRCITSDQKQILLLG